MMIKWWCYVVGLIGVLTACTSDAPAVEKKAFPEDYFFRQRAYPSGEIDHAAYYQAIRAKRQQIQSRDNEPWIFAGPDNVGGRITALAVHPTQSNTIYAGAASGGIFKSSDAGDNWIPIFDEALSLSIGDVAVAPSQADVIYAGTGEANGGGGSLTYDGYGVYRSLNGGTDWQHLGLEQTGSIGRIAIDPTNPNRVFVGAMGSLFANNTHRGLYRTEDGGNAWEQVLFLSDSTGVIDVMIHPTNPAIIYAATWERVRRPNRRNYGGPTSGIWRSTDGGDTWEELTNGLPALDVGRIGLAIAPSAPTVLYALYATAAGHFQGVFKSTDGGDTWANMYEDGMSTTGFMWWFGRIAVHPHDSETLFALTLHAQRSSDGGANWERIFPGVHVDQHALYINPADPEQLILGNDGGVYSSEDGGENWVYRSGLPITQFYTSEIDALQPDRWYGGTQDNGSVRTRSGSTNDWEKILGGDGFVNLIDPENSAYVYAEYQYGNFFRSADGGVDFVRATTGIPDTIPKNWHTPVVFNPQNSQTLYYGADRLYQSTNRAVSWTAISPPLSAAPANSNLVFGTLTAIAVSPVDTQMIYVGTDDGKVWKTENGGNNWELVSVQLPNRWVTSIALHPLAPNVAYVTFSGYRYADDMAHVYRTIDSGESWQPTADGLPEVPVNQLLVDSEFPERLFLANDIGVYLSENAGDSWSSLGTALPQVPVNALSFHPATQMLLAATYGRSMYRYYPTPPSQTTEQTTVDQLHLYPNPTNDRARVAFHLHQAASVTLQLLDQHGRLVYQLPQQNLPAGQQELVIERNDLPAALYFGILSVDQQLLPFRLILD